LAIASNISAWGSINHIGMGQGSNLNRQSRKQSPDCRSCPQRLEKGYVEEDDVELLMTVPPTHNKNQPSQKQFYFGAKDFHSWTADHFQHWAGQIVVFANFVKERQNQRSTSSSNVLTKDLEIGICYYMRFKV
jgi:hypothetical protein